MAGQRSTPRRSRKRRRASAARRGAAPPALPARSSVAAGAAGAVESPGADAVPGAAAVPPRARAGMLGGVGERPPGPFGSVPVSELAILIGGVGLLFGALERRGPALIVGAIVCALGVLEVTAREHFSGFRSHSALLAGFPALGAMLGAATLLAPAHRGLLLVPALVVFAPCFWLLRRRFNAARHARLIRPPSSA